MALAYNAAGPVQILVDTGASNALEVLGYSEDGVRATIERFVHRIHCDIRGGMEGPPDEEQYLGEIHNVVFTLSKYDKAVLNKVLAGVKSQAAGTQATPGTFLAANSFRLVLNSSGDPRNYLWATPLGSIDWSALSRASRIPMGWRCHSKLISDVWTMYNTTTS